MRTSVGLKEVNDMRSFMNGEIDKKDLDILFYYYVIRSLDTNNAELFIDRVETIMQNNAKEQKKGGE